MGKQRARRGVHAAVSHPPEFLARRRIVGDRGAGAGDDHLLAALAPDHGGGGIGLLGVAIGRAVVDVPILAPHGLAGRLVEGDHILQVETVEGHDQQVAVDDGRRAGTAEVVAGKILAGPENLSRFGVEAGGAGAAVMQVEPIAFDRRSARRVAVERVAELRRGDLEHGDVVHDPPVVTSHGHRGQPRAILRGIREPDEVVPDDRRRPGLAGNRCLPGDPAGLAPLDREVVLLRDAVPGAAAKLGPWRGGYRVVRRNWHGEPRAGHAAAGRQGTAKAEPDHPDQIRSSQHRDAFRRRVWLACRCP